MSEAEQRAVQMEAVDDECNRTVNNQLGYAIDSLSWALTTLEAGGDLTSGDLTRLYRALIRMRWVKRRMK